jgi:formyl-CoA transferase
VQERGIVVELPDEEMGRVPMHTVVPRLDGTPGVVRAPAPEIGQHNDEIYAGIGYPADRIRSLRDSGII